MINFILENFDTIFKNKTSLETLDKVILDLAIKGKLVEQNQDDEPASELIKRIKAEKQRLIDEKVIKKEKPLPPIEEEEIPFDIPNSWEWVRLGEIIELLSGQDIPMSKCNSLGKGVPYLLGASNIEESTDEIIVERWIEVPRVIAKKGELLISCKGTVGKIIICNLEEVNLSRQLMGIKLFIGNMNYLKIFFKYYVEKLRNKSKGLIPGISREDILKILFPIPPIEEQKRIVSKVEKLQSIIKDLKEIYIKNQNNRENLKKSLLSEIESQSSDKDLLKNLDLIFANFDKIIKTKEDIKDIRNLILSLAIKGKLVEQNQDDEKASELIKRIKAEKQRLIDEKVIKKEKPLPPIEDEEIPFDIPNSWEWVRFDEISYNYQIGLVRGLLEQSENKKYKYLKMNNITDDGKITLEKIVSVDATLEEYEKYKLKKGDFLFNTRNSSELVGKNAIFDLEGNYLYNNNILRINFYQNINPKIINCYFNSLTGKNKLLEVQSGTTNVSAIYARVLKKIVLPLPPIEEQKRIVSKVESLMKICDLLEEKITLNEKISDKLLESLTK